MSSQQAASSTGGRPQVTAVPRKTISQNKIPAKPCNGFIFKGLLLRSLAEYPVTIRKGHIKPLKIRPSAMEPIDIVLRGSVVTGFYVARLLGSSGFVGLFKTTSNLYVASGLIFKGLIGYFSVITLLLCHNSVA
jgi:hypothetical protein